ncbi:5-oxoprolinase subunit PxpB [Sporomusa acidovorans]|uniref:5-oxoprolinase subunit B n=1 Tax=Sporomusa acidovorans (strain ATCC 49682 / DSM 3132 / Mol) TaxID=1123286 RepID=A0ABZ3J8S2_SPOA4|nr:5-oxoprolinase subunit PxpB [Sporomusa acidovorans]OZC16182.1 kinase A inhibitor [Sporomusa acidovorans DSM 3132]SDE30121.1 inhibitor of KinA [Sporomusa acidovorans]
MDESVSGARLLVAGEYGLVIEFKAEISPAINGLVQQLAGLIGRSVVKGVIEVVPTYRTVMVYFDPLVITRQELSGFIRPMLQNMNPHNTQSRETKTVYVPVCYGGVLGPDLDYVARYTGLPAEEVITVHTATSYRVYMLGFTPGFPYLGGLSAQLAVPRQEKPRAKVPPGSVGIGGSQTGLYPVESPGEWWLIGRTPVKVFNPKAKQPFLLSPGDSLHFYAITVDEYFGIRREVAAGTYVPRICFDSECNAS